MRKMVQARQQTEYKQQNDRKQTVVYCNTCQKELSIPGCGRTCTPWTFELVAAEYLDRKAGETRVDQKNNDDHISEHESSRALEFLLTFLLLAHLAAQNEPVHWR